MPFGLKGAPSTFQKLMNCVFKDLKVAGVVNLYLDDVIIPSWDWTEMLNSFQRVFETLKVAKQTLKLGKFLFGVPQLDYLGFSISKGIIRPSKKLESIASFLCPRNVHEFWRFLGLAGYFRRFIVGYAALSDLLTKLTTKNYMPLSGHYRGLDYTSWELNLQFTWTTKPWSILIYIRL